MYLRLPETSWDIMEQSGTDTEIPDGKPTRPALGLFVPHILQHHQRISNIVASYYITFPTDPNEGPCMMPALVEYVWFYS